MKLSKETLTILKNFGTINSNLILEGTPKLRTMSTGKNIIAEVSAPELEEVQHQFCIYDVNEFLGVLSLFEDPEINIDETSAMITESERSVKYFSASASIFSPVPQIKEFPTPDISFKLSSTFLSQIHKIASVLKGEDVCIKGDPSSGISLQISDKSNTTANQYNYTIGECDKEFEIFFKTENLKMIPGDYTVSIGGKKISRWQHDHSDLVYYVAIELDSTFSF